MPTEHKISTLKINKLTDAQYNSITKSASELYLTPDDGDGLPDQTGNSGKFLTTNGSTASWATVTASGGSVTSVQVQATSPVVSSVNTAQTTSLNTTISLADGYGDTKNPYASKTKNYVLAAPVSANGTPSFRALDKTDIPLASEIAVSGGTTTSLVTTGEKYTWNSKQDALSTQTAYTSKGTATKVPQITTNTLGQVTGITEVDITHQSIKTLKTDNTTAQSTSSSEAIAGSGTINLHKVSKTGSYNDLLNKPTIPQGTVTSVQVQAGTGLSSSTSTAQSTTLNTTISVASGYKLPTTTEWSNKQDALPSQTGNSGKFLTTNGSTMSWGAVDALPNQTGQSGKFLTTNGSTAAWAAVSVDIDDSTITKNTNDEIQVSGIKDERTDNTIQIWTGNKSQYDNLKSSNWTTPVQGTNFGSSSTWQNLAYGNDKFVIMSSNGYISTSTDGINWTAATYNSTLGNKSWSSLAYGNGKFVTISANSIYVSTSTDGTTWTTPVRNNNLDIAYNDYFALTYSNNKFVALSIDGYISTSTDGTDWTAATYNSNLGDTKQWFSIIYGNGMFVASGIDGYISTSTDGTDWTAAVLINNLSGYTWQKTLTYDGSKFILLSDSGYISTSTDGTTWTTPTLVDELSQDYSWCNLIYNNDKLVALDMYGGYTSIKNKEIDPNTLYNVIDDGLYLGINKIFKPINVDNSTITKNINDELQTVGVKDARTNNTIKTWTGTKAQYDAASIVTWTNSANLDSDGHYWYALAYGNGKFVAIDLDSYISTSTDGINWTNATQDSNLSYRMNWNRVTYGDGKFVALSQFGGYSSSTDGTTWAEPNDLDGGMSWYALTYGNGKFVAISEDAYISTSTDGSTWTSVVQDSNLNYGSDWFALAYNGTKFVALSRYGDISTSTDGTTWEEAAYNNNLGANYWTSLVYDGIKFVAISGTGYISTSTDGTTWTTAVQDNSLNSIGGYWSSSTVSNGRISILNEDGKIATQIGGIDTNTLYNIENYGLYLGTTKIANTSEDLNIDNSTITKNESDELQTVGIKDVRTDNTIKTWTGTRTQYDNLTSDSWSIAAQDSNLSTYNNWLVTYGDGKFVAINGNGGNNGRGYVSTSTNGTTWNTLTHVNNLDSDDIGSWMSLAYGNGKFVAISTWDYISTSTDGSTWTTPTYTNNLGTLGENYWESLAYGNGKFVAIDGNYGYVSTSTDGITWTTLIQISDFYNVNNWKLTYGNGKFVAINNYGYISTSTNGTTWTTAVQDSNLEAIDLQYDSSWRSLVYDGTKFVAISGNGCISTSTDGTAWTVITQVNNLGDNNWTELVYDETKVVAVSHNSYISTKISGLHSNTLYNVIDSGLYLGTDQIAVAMPLVSNITSTTPTITAQANTNYICSNAVTSLTLSSAPNSPLEINIYFTTSSSSFTFTNNSTVTKWIGAAPTFSTNKSYVMNICNGIGCVAEVVNG